MRWGGGFTAKMRVSHEKVLQAGRPHFGGGGQLKYRESKSEGLILPTPRKSGEMVLQG